MASETDGINIIKPRTPPPSNIFAKRFQASTIAIHADDILNRDSDVAPAFHVSSTFRYASNPAELVPARDVKVWPNFASALPTSRRSIMADLFAGPKLRTLPRQTRIFTPAKPPPTPPDSRRSSNPSSLPQQSPTPPASPLYMLRTYS